MAPGNNHVTSIPGEIFKYVRIQPNFASRPVLCEKLFLCRFFPKSTEKRLDKQARKSTPTPTPPPYVPLNDVKRILAVFLPCSTECPYLVYPNSTFFEEGGAMGGGGGGGWGRGVGETEL